MTLDTQADTSANAAALARTTRQAHAAIGMQLASLGPATEGPRYLRPLVRTGYSILLAAVPLLAHIAASRLTPGPDTDTGILDSLAPTASLNSEGQACAYAQALNFVLAEAAVRLDLPAFIPALPLLRVALQLRAQQHLTHSPDATAALIASHTPALLQALRAGEAEAAELHATALRSFMLVEHADFVPYLHLPAHGAAHAGRLPAWP